MYARLESRLRNRSLGFCGYLWIPDLWVGPNFGPMGTQIKGRDQLVNRRKRRSGVIENRVRREYESFEKSRKEKK